MRIVVCTTSALKIEAVQTVFKEATIIGVQTASGVPEQPVEDQTETGAYNRLREAKRLRPDADLYIGIENGIFYDNGNYVDKAIVIIENKDGERQSACSLGVIFPKEFFLEAQRRGFDTITVGQVMFEAGKTKTKNDPHADLGDKISRVVFLTDTISTAFEQLTNRLSTSLHFSSLEGPKSNQDKNKEQFLSQFKVTRKDITSGKYSCISALTICKFTKWNRPKVYKASITEEVIGKLLKNDLTIQGLPKFISDFLNLKPSRHRETLVYRPELIDWTPCKQYLLMPNPAYTNHQLLLDDPTRAKYEKEGFALVAWFIHPTLLAQSRYSDRQQILDSLIKNNESLRYGKFGNKNNLYSSLFHVNTFSDLIARDKDRMTTDELVQNSGIPYISGAFDYKPEDLASLKLLRDFINKHLRDIYGITEQDRVDLYFHTHYDTITTTAHLHVRVNQLHHGLELSRSVFLNEVIDRLEQGGNVKDLFIEKEYIHVGPNAHQFLDRIGYTLQEVDNPYYIENLIEEDATGEFTYTFHG